MIDCVMRKKLSNSVSLVRSVMIAFAACIELLFIIRGCEVACHIDIRLQMMTDTNDAMMSGLNN